MSLSREERALNTLIAALICAAVVLCLSRFACATQPGYDPGSTPCTSAITYYPANGATGVPLDVLIYIVDSTAIEHYKFEQTAITVNGVQIAGDDIFADQGTYYDREIWNFDAWNDGGSEIKLQRLVNLAPFTRYTITFFSYGWEGVDCDQRNDTVSFITRSITTPFYVGPQVWSITDSTATGMLSLRVTRPAGTTAYCLTPDGTVFTLIAPLSDYTTERRKQFTRVTLDDIPQGHSKYRYWCVDSDGEHSDTTNQWLTYTQRIRGRQKGVIGR